MSATGTFKDRVSAIFGRVLGTHWAQVVLIAIASAAIALSLGHAPLVGDVFSKPEQWTQDIRLTVGPASKEQHPDIIVVTLTEDLLDQFPYRSPVDRKFLADLITMLGQRHVRAIGLDVLFDKPTEPEKDEEMRQALRHLPVPIVVSYVQDPRLMDEAGLKYLRDFVPPEDRGMANIVTTDDGAVRYIYPGEMDAQGNYIPGLARAILKRLGIQTPNEQPLLRYRLKTADGLDPFRIYPAQLVPILPASLFEGKIVLIGADLTLIDRHRTPFATAYGDINGKLPGVVIHAHGLAQLLDKKGVTVTPFWAIVALTLGLATIGTLLGRLPIPLWARGAGGLVVVALYWAAGFYIYHVSEIMLPLVVPTIATVVAGWLTDVVTGRQMRKQRNFIQGAMGRFVSEKVVSELMKDPLKLSVTASRRNMTYLFTDIAGFTTLSETVSSDKLSKLLNDYLFGLCEEIHQREGTVCRFIGDAVFALWNAPSDQPDHAARAVSCAMAIDAYAEKFRVEQKELNGFSLGATRIGVHGGEAMVGNFGSPQRMEYTALGDNVNSAARLESLNKFFGTRVAISNVTAEQAPGVIFRPIANVVVKGKTLPMKILEPCSKDAIASGYVDRYNAAYQALVDGAPNVQELFEALEREDPSDGCVKFYLERLHQGLTDSVVVMHEK